MTKRRERIGALFLAVVFFMTAVVFSVVLLFQADDQSKQQAELEQQLQEQLQAQQSEDPACQMDNTATAPTYPVPEAFKPPADVSALEVTDLEAGTGQEIQVGSCVEMKYHGTLATTGDTFDGNFDQPAALRFRVGQGSVIQGWDEGLIGLKEGGTRRLVIPSEMAYGEFGQGSIPANADLVFVVRLEKISE